MNRNDPTSPSLLLRVRANDEEAWRRVVSLYSPLVAHWFVRWKARPEDVPDLMQEVFAAVSAGLATYRPERPGATFRGWLRAIARNKLHDLARRQQPATAEGGTEAMFRLEGVPVPDDAPDPAESDFEATLLYRRAVEQVRAQFEERTWNAFWLVAMERRTTDAVAAELGLTPNGVRQAKSRVLRRIRQELGELIA